MGIENDNEIDDFSLGHMTIIGTLNSCTSKGKVPNQSMMIFISIPLLLDGIRQFLNDKKSLTYNFVGVDCSFQFFLLKVEKEEIVIKCEKDVIDQVNSNELILAVWNGVQGFTNDFGQHLEPNRDSNC